MIVTGIDLSLTSTGMVRADDGVFAGFFNPKTKGKRGDTLEQRQKRLYDLANEIVAFATPSDLVVIESPSYGSVGAGTFDRSGAWWLVVSALIADDIPVAMVSPQGRAKYGSGKGNAKKDVVLAFVREYYTDWFGARIPNDDVADATLLCAMGCRHLGHPVEDWELPVNAIDAMTGATWTTTV